MVILLNSRRLAAGQRRLSLAHVTTLTAAQSGLTRLRQRCYRTTAGSLAMRLLTVRRAERQHCPGSSSASHRPGARRMPMDRRLSQRKEVILRALIEEY